MKPFVRNSVALAFAGALAASAATPVLAADLASRSFAASPVAANGYYGPRDYRSGSAYEQSYVREPNYNYQSNYVRQPNYVYGPDRTYVVPAAQIEYRPSRCWISTNEDRGVGYWGYCASSDATLDDALSETPSYVRATDISSRSKAAKRGAKKKGFCPPGQAKKPGKGSAFNC